MAAALISLETSRRRALSVLLLLVQVLALAHLAVAEHVVTSTGSLVDAQGLSVELHDANTADHLCAGDDDAAHALGQDDCVIGAGWKTGRVASPAVIVLTRDPERGARRLTRVTTARPLSPLELAPKASPPAR